VALRKTSSWQNKTPPRTDNETENQMSVSHDRGDESGDSGGHHHGPASYDRAFAIGVALNLGFVGIESFYGFSVNSLALLADAGHNLSDVAGLLLAWAAAWLTRKASSQRRTYGFGRASIMASLVNAVVLLIGVDGIAWEAIRRLPHPAPLAGETVMWVAALGIAVNAGTAVMFMAGRKDDINIRGAFLHMAADAGVALGVVVAAFIMSRTGWLWLDPVMSLGIGVVIAVGTWGLFQESLNLALDAVPAGVNREAVEDFLSEVPGVVAIHDLHIWPLSTTSVALTAHLVNPDAIVDDNLMRGLSTALHKQFGIDHTTLQVERENGGCHLAEIHSVPPFRP
jgi:cobalt-zinc-cadmium efflux system protein